VVVGSSCFSLDHGVIFHGPCFGLRLRGSLFRQCLINFVMRADRAACVLSIPREAGGVSLCSQQELGLLSVVVV